MGRHRGSSFSSLQNLSSKNFKNSQGEKQTLVGDDQCREEVQQGIMTMVNRGLEEINLPGHTYSPEQHNWVHKIVKNGGMYSKTYNKGQRRRIVISRMPLPDYRPEYDLQRITHQINIPLDLKAKVQSYLRQQMESYTPPDRYGSNHRSRKRNMYQFPYGRSEDLPPPPPKRSEIKIEPKDSAQGEQQGAAMASAQQTGQLVTSTADLDRREVRLGEMIRQDQLDGAANPSAQRLNRTRQQLPCWNMKEQILDAIEKQQVVLVSGDTGCGKTTQVPQFILEDRIGRGLGAVTSIVCTQPRRISAIAVGERVAAERGEYAGQSVGFQVMMNSCKSNRTRLLFCTSGLLLRRLIVDSELRGTTHVIIDEVHEQGLNEDFLMMILKGLLPQRPDLRVILMSATLNTEKFKRYFPGCAHISVPGRTFPVTPIYLDKILDMTGISLAPNSRTQQRVLDDPSKVPYQLNYRPPPCPRQPPGRYDFYSKRGPGTKDGDDEITPETPYPPWYQPTHYQRLSPTVQESMRVWAVARNHIDYKLLLATVRHIVQYGAPGGILVFLAGWDEISWFKSDLAYAGCDRSMGVEVQTIHGSLPVAQQRQIFEALPPGMRRVVLATNVAEASITVPDIVHVVDTGRAKEKGFDALNRISTLRAGWVSKASTKQRMGRAGRVQEGWCYKLYPKKLEDTFIDHQLPELLRTPLTQVALQIKSLGLGDVQKFLATAMQAPSPQTVHYALQELRAIGALDEREALTKLGQHLATLPSDAPIGKMLIMASVLGCLDPILTVAAAMQTRDPFRPGFDDRQACDAAKYAMSDRSQSDHIAIINAFNEYRRLQHSQELEDWCARNYLCPSTLNTISKMRKHLARTLVDIGFLDMEKSMKEEYGDRGYDVDDRDIPQSVVDERSEYKGSKGLVLGVITAGLFPNVVFAQMRKKGALYKSWSDGEITIMQSSVISRDVYLPQRWLVYGDKVKTTSVRVEQISLVNDFAMVLMGGEWEPCRDPQVAFTMLNGILTFQANKQVVTLLSDLKRRVQELIDSKVDAPKTDIMLTGGPVVRGLIEMLECQEPVNDRQALGLEAPGVFTSQQGQDAKSRGYSGLLQGQDRGVGVYGVGNGSNGVMHSQSYASGLHSEAHSLKRGRSYGMMSDVDGMASGNGGEGQRGWGGGAGERRERGRDRTRDEGRDGGREKERARGIKIEEGGGWQRDRDRGRAVGGGVEMGSDRGQQSLYKRDSNGMYARYSS